MMIRRLSSRAILWQTITGLHKNTDVPAPSSSTPVAQEFSSAAVELSAPRLSRRCLLSGSFARETRVASRRLSVAPLAYDRRSFRK